MVKLEINNRIYDDLGHSWWDENGNGNLISLRYLTNPVKFKYINNIIKNQRKSQQNVSVLDVGCGGGYLAEELAKAGLTVTGLDPSNASLVSAKIHANQKNLDIQYVSGFGEELPFESNSFDFVCCCDVLEHVENFALILKEISRVLKGGGILFYDTINRTIISKFVVIKAMQEWGSISFLEPDIHIWDMFITPKELIEILSRHGLENREIKGLSPSLNFVAHYLNLRARKNGSISWKALGNRLNLKISRNTSCTYIGYAVKSNDN